RVAVPTPSRPVRRQRPTTVKVWNSTPGGRPAAAAAHPPGPARAGPPWPGGGGLGVSGPPRVGIRPRAGAPRREAAEPERRDVDRLGPALRDQLGHARAHRRGDLEAGAAERGGQVEPVDAV